MSFLNGFLSTMADIMYLQEAQFSMTVIMLF